MRSVFVTLCLVVAPLAGQSVSVMGYNVEGYLVKDDQIRWKADLDTVAARVRQLAAEHDPDIWGFSEVPDRIATSGNPTSWQWIRDLTKACQRDGRDFKYVFGTTGRADRLAVVYDAKRFDLLDDAGKVVRPGEEEFDEEEFELTAISGASMGNGKQVGGRAPMAMTFALKGTPTQFVFMVNHLHRRAAGKRWKQATLLNEWGAKQALPVIAVGDYNFDWDTANGDHDHDPGYDNMVAGGVFRWIRPRPPLVRTQANPDYDSVLDFVFAAGAARRWVSHSVIVQSPDDFTDWAKTADHRPVFATFDVGAANDHTEKKAQILERIQALEREIKALKQLVEGL